MKNENKYRNIFSRLCHLVTLKKNSRLTAAIEGVLLTTFAYDADFAPSSVDEILDAVSVFFGIQLSKSETEESLKSLLDDGRLLSTDGTYSVDPGTLSQYSKSIARANEIELRAKAEWFREIADIDSINSCDIQSSIWTCLMSYMARAFYRHGVQTMRLLDPSIPSDADDTVGLESYFREAKDQHCNDIPDQIVSEALDRFFTFKSQHKTRFTVQLLDGTFTYFALTTDADVAQYLTESIPPVSIFMDSNFIFGLLALHENPLNEVSKDLVECVFANDFPFTLYYTTETLDEIEKSLQYNGDRLRGVLWTSETSRQALKSRYLSGLERRFHKLNADSPRNADHFLSQFEQMPALLENMRFSEYNAKPLVNNQEQIDLYHEYEEYLKRRGRKKRYEVINHDVYLWRTVQDNRTAKGQGLSAGAFLMTVDYNLATFDRRKLRNQNHVASTIFPNQLFQLLRPFIVTSDAVDEQFVETFALPEFRAAEDDYGDTVAMVLKVMNSYSEVSDEFAIKLLTDTMTLEQFKEFGPDVERVQQLVSNELVNENHRLREENKQLESRAANIQNEAEAIREQSKQSEALLEQTVEEKEKQDRARKVTINALEADSRSKSEELDALKEEKRKNQRLKFAVRWALVFEVVALIASGLLMYLFLPDWFSSHMNKIGLLFLGIVSIGAVTSRIAFGHRWEWLATHPNRLGLQASSAIVLIGLFVVLADPQSSGFGVVGMFIGGGGLAIASKIDRM